LLIRRRQKFGDVEFRYQLRKTPLLASPAAQVNAVRPDRSELRDASIPNHVQRRYAGFSCRTPLDRSSLTIMRFTLKALYRNGVVLDAKELADAPSYVGSFILEAELNGDCLSRQARLLDTALNALRDIVPPLLDPEVVSMDENQIVVRGYQLINTEDRLGLRHKQCWLLRPVAGEWHGC
jgi:hypothetical protein